ncbi:hypothetical protein MAR_025087 [Mya arenaria]|uniref:Fibronectin type-III domain-containing protein n=2 Tax=Mya arenaria TaxID=6604 RepID=A0ABY7DVP2_MYAAR|nr:hypothetical protein MAR_025087 [Mya arenaria]
MEVCGSGNSATSVRFEDMMVDTINATTLHLDWCPLLNCDTLYGYKIRYSIKDHCSYNEIFVTSGISSYTISGLKPNTEYIISVNAVDAEERTVHNCGWGTFRTDDLDDEHQGRQESPYLAAIAGALLIVIALVVPITLLFVKKCGPCNGSINDNSSNIDKGVMAEHTSIQPLTATDTPGGVVNRRTNQDTLFDHVVSTLTSPDLPDDNTESEF